MEVHELLTRLAQDEISAMEILYTKVKHDAFMVGMKYLHNVHDAEDACQQTFFEVWKNRKKYNPERSGGKAWILTFTRRYCLNLLKRRKMMKIKDYEYSEEQKRHEESIWENHLNEMDNNKLFIDFDRDEKIIAMYLILGFKRMEILQFMSINKNRYHYLLGKIEKVLEKRLII